MKSSVYYYEAVVACSNADTCREISDSEVLITGIKFPEVCSDDLVLTIATFKASGIFSIVSKIKEANMRSFRTRSLPGNESIILSTFYAISTHCKSILDEWLKHHGLQKVEKKGWVKKDDTQSD